MRDDPYGQGSFPTISGHFLTKIKENIQLLIRQQCSDPQFNLKDKDIVQYEKVIHQQPRSNYWDSGPIAFSNSADYFINTRTYTIDPRSTTSHTVTFMRKSDVGVYQRIVGSSSDQKDIVDKIKEAEKDRRQKIESLLEDLAKQDISNFDSKYIELLFTIIAENRLITGEEGEYTAAELDTALKRINMERKMDEASSATFSSTSSTLLPQDLGASSSVMKSAAHKQAKMGRPKILDRQGASSSRAAREDIKSYRTSQGLKDLRQQHDQLCQALKASMIDQLKAEETAKRNFMYCKEVEELYPLIKLLALRHPTADPSPTNPMLKELTMVLAALEGSESEEANIAMGLLNEAFTAISDNDFQTAKYHLKVVERMGELVLSTDLINKVRTVLQQCERSLSDVDDTSPQPDIPLESMASSSSASPSQSLSDPSLEGKGHGSETDGVNPGAMVAQLRAEELQCPIKFSRYQDLPETILLLESKALIELIGDGPSHWVVKFTMEDTILLIWPGDIPTEILASDSYAGIVVVSVPQNPEECAAAALNYLVMLEGITSSKPDVTSPTTRLLLDSTVKSDDAISTCIEVSNSLFGTILNYAMNLDPRSFLQQQLQWLKEIIQDGLNNEWLSSEQKLQLKVLFFDVGASLSIPIPPFRPDHEDPDGNYGGGGDLHKDMPDQDIIGLAGQHNKTTTGEE